MNEKNNTKAHWLWDLVYEQKSSISKVIWLNVLNNSLQIPYLTFLDGCIQQGVTELRDHQFVHDGYRDICSYSDRSGF